MAFNFKSRKHKFLEYENNYSEIPRDFKERLEWMYDKYHISEKKSLSIINKRNAYLDSLYYTSLFITLYEEPEGSPRPRARLVNRQNLANMALSNSSFIQVYSLTGREDNLYMKRLLNEKDFDSIKDLICTPCNIEYSAFFKTPSAFGIEDIFLSELGIIRPIVKPDWDNLGKKYSDMYNANIWLDDTLVIDATVKKYYSILPRIEIKLNYLNMLYNKYQYNSISKRVGVTNKDSILYFEKEKKNV